MELGLRVWSSNPAYTAEGVVSLESFELSYNRERTLFTKTKASSFNFVGIVPELPFDDDDMHSASFYFHGSDDDNTATLAHMNSFIHRMFFELTPNEGK